MGKKVLVTGGCGYIGSHTLVDLIHHGFEVLSVDNLLNSYTRVLDGIEQITGKKVTNYEIDLSDAAACRAFFEQHSDIEGVIHFAALKAVGESVELPVAYFKNNLNSLLNVVDCCVKNKIDNFIFSSSCSVYGNAKELPVTENTPFGVAESPYARTKQMGEEMLTDICKRYKSFNSIILRYFNPAGAHESNKIGEDPKKVGLNLVPVIVETAIGAREKTMVHGTDYNTRDGSCIRDYIHIMDLANAHTKSLEYLFNKNNTNNCEVYNLGIGEGVSVLEAIHAFEAVTGLKLNYEKGPRRAGDVEAIYSNYKKAADRLGWKPQFNINDIMRTAWEWEQKRSGKVLNS